MAHQNRQIEELKPSQTLRPRLVDENLASPPSSRIWALDFFRGLAVLAMVIYHFNFDLIKVYKIPDYLGQDFWFLGGKLIGGSFLFISGLSLASLYLKSNQSIKAKKFFKNLLKLALIAAIITIATLWLSPKNPILFGIIHCIALCLGIGFFVVKLKNSFIFVGSTLILLSPLWMDFVPLDHPLLFWLWQKALPINKMMDYFQMLPYSGLFFMGIGFGNFVFPRTLDKITKPYPFYGSKPILFMGRHSLFIYILHQPLLLGILYLYFQILPVV